MGKARGTARRADARQRTAARRPGDGHRRRDGHGQARLLGAALAALVVALAGCTQQAHPPPAPTPAPTPRPTPREPSALNGVPEPPGADQHRVSAIVIDNFPDARPQSGLHDAEIVYEAEAEGGITRYLALYLANMPAKIGPVRSARLYFVEIARAYDAFFAHSGENDDVWTPLSALRAGGFPDFDEITVAGEAFWRDGERAAPHNLYTNIWQLRKTAPNHGWQDQTFARAGWAFEARPDPPAAPEVIVDFWNDYRVKYDYKHGAYERRVEGVLQHDREDPRPYRVSDIVVTWVPARVLDVLGDLSMDVYGSHPAVVVRDGRVTQGEWTLLGPDAAPALTDASGAAIPLTPGQIYVEVLPQGGRLTIGKTVWTH